jgi:branched-chain amino acid transport system ATP-binding protein
MALLEVENLHVSYGAIAALRGVSFQVEAGQVVTLIGANGAGKSTTLNALSGLVRVKSGRIVFDGQEITHQRPDRISKGGLVQVPEGRQVIAPMSVLENLEIGASGLRGAAKQRAIAEVFERFPRLQERRLQKAGSLSGGEQQMLAVGRALLMRPRLLMLDEPSMGLAPILVNEVFSIIAAIKAQGTTILLVEQNARKALQLAEMAYILERGTVANHGPANELGRNSAIIAAYLG